MAKQAPKQAPAVTVAHPIGSVQPGSKTYAGTTPNAKSVTCTTACGATVTLSHVVRRRYVVYNAKGVALGYITAANASNAIGRVNVTPLTALKLH